MYVSLARSSDLAGKSAFIVVMSRGDTLFFEGCMQLKVLCGLLHVHGHTLTPSPSPYPLFSPTHSSHFPLAAVDPHSVRLQNSSLWQFLRLLSQHSVQFASLRASQERPSSSSSDIYLDLDREDIRWLNVFSGVAISCVFLVWNLDSPLVSGLQTVPNCGLPKFSNGHSKASFKLYNLKECLRNGLAMLNLPPPYLTIADDIVDHIGAVVLVCGDVGTGKSTFCRHLINLFLNRCRRVGYLECDVGQTEFTVAAVTALHVLTEPVFGPAHTHPRKAYKAYYFGHSSPGDKPRYYVHLIKQLHSLFIDEVHGNGEVPLIINTCGWVTDLGVPLMMDIIRLTSPTHIVRLTPNTSHRMFYSLTDLLPFTPHTLTSTPGTLTLPTHLPHSVEEKWYATNIPRVQAPHATLGHGDTPMNLQVPVPNLDQATPNQKGTTPGHGVTTPVLGQTTESDESSSDDEEKIEVIYVDSNDSCDPESDVEIIGYDPPPLGNTHTPLPTPTPSHSQNEVGTKEAEKGERERDMYSDRKRRRDGDVEQGTSSSSLASKVGRRRRATAAKISKERRRRRGLRKISIPGQNVDWISQTMNTSATSAHWHVVEGSMVNSWTTVLDYRVCVLRAASGIRGKDSRRMRSLALVAHFSPLISGCDNHTHFMDKAPVVQVPWSEVAIHVLQEQVPHSDMLYTMKGSYIALGRVDPSEVVEQQVKGGGTVRFLRSHTPVIEFLAMGVFRGACPDKQLYYVTTPLFVTDPVAMDTVNVLVMGEGERLYGFSKVEATPISYQHIITGQLAWKHH